MGRVGIVCDSTCDLGLPWLSANDVTMVPLKVLFGDVTFLDWVELEPADFYSKLMASKTLPKTSQPSPAEFTAAYARLAEEGCTDIVSVHLTSALSGTFESATLAAVDSPIPVHVVDTKHVTHATGLAVKAAVRSRDAGSDAATVARVATETAAQTRMFFILDTLEYLVKGGRAGAASGLAASVLNIKPILTFNREGTIEPFRKVKGMRKAMSGLAEFVAESSAEHKVSLAVFSACDPGLAQELVVAFDAAGARYVLDEGEWQIGAVIGTYAGPRAVGCAYHPLP